MLTATPTMMIRACSAEGLDLSSTLFLHKTDEVSVGVTNKSCPQLVVGHLGGKLRRAFVLCSSLNDRSMGRNDVGDLEVGYRVVADGPGTLWCAQHDAHAASGQKSEIGCRTKEERQTEDIAIKRQRRSDIADGNGNL